MSNNNAREQLLAMINDFVTTGNATGTLHTGNYTYDVTMFRQRDRIILTGVNAETGGMPQVFAVSNGTRVLFGSNYGCDLNNIHDAVVENDASVDPLQRTMVRLNALSEVLKNELITRCADVCQAHIADEYGDREPLESCVCSDEDISIAASYRCTQILAETGSFEDMQKYINTNIDEDILYDNRPAFETPTEFYRWVTEEETVRLFMGGVDAIEEIAKERLNSDVLAAYGAWAIRMVKWYRDRQEILDADEEFKTATAINQAIKAFQADDKFAKAKMLTYIVKDNEGRCYRFRMDRDVLLRKRGFSVDERVYRVPGYHRPRSFEMSNWTPFNIEEIHYVKHVVYRKAA